MRRGGNDAAVEPARVEPARQPTDLAEPPSAANAAEAPSAGPPAADADPGARSDRAGTQGWREPPVPAPVPPAAARPPTPHDLAELGGTFALTSGVHDPDPDLADAVDLGERGDDPHTERGLRGLVGGGSSQVSVAAAMRARDAARPTAADLAAAEAELVIIRRGWVPRDDLPRSGPRRA